MVLGSVNICLFLDLVILNSFLVVGKINITSVAKSSIIPKSSMADIKLIVVVCGLMFMSFDSTTFAFIGFIENNGLDING